MQHPLEDPSLTPFGFVLPNWKYRLAPLAKDMINGDREISLLWAAENRMSSESRPAVMMIGEILPSIITTRQFSGGDFFFDGRLYYRRDILVLSSFIAWLGCNCGLAFLRGNSLSLKSMVKRFDAYEAREQIVYHVLKRQPHYIERHVNLPDITKRDEALIRSIMYWLNRTEGKEFVQKLQTDSIVYINSGPLLLESESRKCAKLRKKKPEEFRTLPVFLILILFFFYSAEYIINMLAVSFASIEHKLYMGNSF